jgi:hypothetical protein
MAEPPVLDLVKAKIIELHLGHHIQDQLALSDFRAQSDEGFSRRKPDVYSMEPGKRWAFVTRPPDDRPQMETSQQTLGGAHSRAAENPSVCLQLFLSENEVTEELNGKGRMTRKSNPLAEKVHLSEIRPHAFNTLRWKKSLVSSYFLVAVSDTSVRK